MAVRDKVTKEDFDKYGTVAAALAAKHRIMLPRKVVIIAATKLPDDSYTVLFDIEKEAPAKQPPQQAPAKPTEPRVAILKIPRGVKADKLQGLVNSLANVIGCAVFVMPTDFEVLLGNTAKEELEKIHNTLHKMLGLDK